VAEADTGHLDRVLGPEWQGMSFLQLDARARKLETAAGFARTLVDYMLDGYHRAAGDVLAAVAERNSDGDYTDGYSIG
jgi:hypothetical protein